MTRIDRILVGLLIAGIWALVLTADFHTPAAHAASIDVSEVDGLEELIEQVVESCTVSGDVYIYDDSEGGYGEIGLGSIDC